MLLYIMFIVSVIGASLVGAWRENEKAKRRMDNPAYRNWLRDEK